MVVHNSGLTQRQTTSTSALPIVVERSTTMDTTNIRRRRTPHHSSSSNNNIKSWMLIMLVSITIFMFGLFITIISQHKKQLKTSGALYTKTITANNNNINNLSNTAAACPHGEERTWHGGHPAQDHPGSCWCGQDEYCMCTPSVAIDIVLYQRRPRSAAKSDGNTNPSSGRGAEYNYDVWVVRRSDTNQLATIGGFVDTGETTESAVLREVQEETGITIPPQLMSSHSGGGDSGGAFPNKNNSAIKLIGVYSDPRRDNRRHIVSIAYALEFIPDIMTTKDGRGIPHAGDDAKDVIAIPLEEIGVKYVGEDWYADHLSILLDFKMQIMAMKDGEVDRSKELYGGDVARSTCS